MGLFDRFSTPSEAFDRGMTPPLHETSPVPRVDDESSHLDSWVRDHLSRLTDAAESDIDAMTSEDFDEALTVRLAGADRLAETGLGFASAQPFAEGIVEVLTLDLPDAVVTLPDARLAGYDRDRADLVEIGRRNLARLLASTDVDVELLTAGTSSCVLVHGDSPYIASFARLLDDAVRLWLPEADPSNGIVFAVPHRHAVVLQTCETAASARSALELVPWHAAQLYGEGIGPVSPHTYYRRGGAVTALTRATSARTLELHPTPFLESLVAEHRHAG